MSSINKIILIGRLTTEPEVRVTTEGTALTKFTLTVDRAFTNEDKVDLINILCWSKLAEQAGDTFKKDMLVLVEGRIQVSTFENKEGEKVWNTEVVANYLKPMETIVEKKVKLKYKEEEKAEVNAKAMDTEKEEEFTEDDIPF